MLAVFFGIEASPRRKALCLYEWGEKRRRFESVGRLHRLGKSTFQIRLCHKKCVYCILFFDILTYYE